jgi:hypothetical protein
LSAPNLWDRSHRKHESSSHLGRPSSRCSRRRGAGAARAPPTFARASRIGWPPPGWPSSSGALSYPCNPKRFQRELHYYEGDQWNCPGLWTLGTKRGGNRTLKRYSKGSGLSMGAMRRFGSDRERRRRRANALSSLRWCCGRRASWTLSTTRKKTSFASRTVGLPSLGSGRTQISLRSAANSDESASHLGCISIQPHCKMYELLRVIVAGRV